MTTTVVMCAIFALLFGGALMALFSKRAALLDARVSLAIAHAIIPRRMRSAWKRAEGFKKNAGRKNIILVYKIVGMSSVILGAGLAIFLLTIS